MMEKTAKRLLLEVIVVAIIIGVITTNFWIGLATFLFIDILTIINDKK